MESEKNLFNDETWNKHQSSVHVESQDEVEIDSTNLNQGNEYESSISGYVPFRFLIQSLNIDSDPSQNKTSQKSCKNIKLSKIDLLDDWKKLKIFLDESEILKKNHFFGGGGSKNFSLNFFQFSSQSIFA